MRWFVRLGLAASMLCACSLTGSLDSLQENSGSTDAGKDGGGGTGADAGNLSCGPGHKPCGTSCVSINDPATGCGEPSCEACSPANASPLCVSGACALGQCANGFEDCDGDATNGCEVSLKSSAENCGACFATCLLPNQQVSCIGGTCQAGACDAGYAECDGDPANGCETNTGADPTNCGACGAICPVPSGKSATCEAGVCGISNCVAPLADCDKDTQGSCETDTSNAPLHCGFCGGQCAYTNGVPVCNSGACALGSCQSGWGNCDGNTANGCETGVGSSLANCGSCGNACSGGAHAQPQCAQGSCGLKCDAGWGNCDGVLANGCESPLNTNANCGVCGNVISVFGTSPAGTVSASGNTITFTHCDSENGCEPYPITLTGFTASGNAPIGTVSAAGNTITFTKCDPENGCDSYPITLSGATASGSAPGGTVSASGDTITFTKCDPENGCESYPITFSCAP